MIHVAASLVAGLGLFFVGLYFLAEHLKMLSGRRLRERIAAWTKNPFMGVLWGGVFVAVKGVRSAYLSEESGLDATERMRLLAAANLCERLIWLFGNMGRDYMALKA